MSTFDAISVSEEILNRKISFLKVVESFEEKLISPNVNEREEAVKQLTDVLLHLPFDFLSDLEVSTLLRFFSARLADSVLLTSSCLKSLYFLSQCSNFPNGGEQAVLTSLFKEHMVQALVQQDRFLVFSLIKHYLATRIVGLKSFDTEFILGFIQAADGEKDPRNLMLIFECFSKIASEFSLGPFSEDMFELVACYFPIDFKPAADDPYSITSTQLSVALDRCLTCNGLFAKFCYQMLQEKFDENKPEELFYILKLLSKALVAFPPTATAEFSVGVWQEVRKIIITSKNQGEIERSALECLKNLIISLTKCESNDFLKDGRNSTLVSLVGQISKDCEHFLSNAEMQLMDVGNKMALTVAETESNVCNRMATIFLPLLMEKYQTQTSNKIDYANFLFEWISILADMNKRESILNVKQSLTAILCDNILPLADPNLTQLGIKMATKLLQIDENLFTCEQLMMIFDRCVRFVDGKSTEKKIFLESILLIKILCKRRRDLVKKYFDQNKNFDSLNVYAIAIVDETTSEWFLPLILNFSNLTMKNFDSLRLFIDENRTNFDQVLKTSWRPICLKLFESAKCCIEHSSEKEFNEMHESVTRIGNLSQELFVCLDAESESEMFEIFVEPLRQTSVCETFWIILCEKLIVALSETNIEKATSFVISACSFVVENVSKPCSNLNRTLADSWARSLAAILNKLPQSSPAVKILIENYVDVLESNISLNETALICFGYSTKALLLRNLAPLCSKCFSKLVEMLNGDFSDVAEKSLETIFIEDSNFLSSKTKAKFTFLYKQRIFTEFVSLLTKNFIRAEKTEWKKNYFRILTVLLSNTPKEIQMSSEIEKLIPLLVNSIQSEDSDILLPSVCSVETLLNADGAVSKLQQHIHSLTQRLCKLAKKERNIDLQLTCLRCLSKISSVVAPSILGPWRQQVLKSLSGCLDDPKRLVRRQAVECRNKWFLLT